MIFYKLFQNLTIEFFELLSSEIKHTYLFNHQPKTCANNTLGKGSERPNRNFSCNLSFPNKYLIRKESILNE